MDVLSEVLRAVKLEGALFFNAEFSAPWCISSPGATGMAPYLYPVTGHLIMFHFLTEGRAYARIADGRRVKLSAGDIVVLPHGDAHFLGNGFPENPVDSLKTFSSSLTQGLKVARYGGGGEVTRFVCGYLACDPGLSQVFLAGLPQILTVPVAADPSGQWLEHFIRFSVDGVNGMQAGGGLMLAKMSEVLFVETMRRYINALPSDQTGWLAGARDPGIGQTLALMHKNPADPWTIPILAKQVGLSRTRFAERFRHFLGESPMAYLAQWRLKLGADILQSTEDSITDVAAAVGYGSESAFNRAFKRKYDCPPAQYRRKHSPTNNLRIS